MSGRTFNVVLRRTQYPSLYPVVHDEVRRRRGIVPVSAGTNSVTLGDAALNAALIAASVRVPASSCPPISGATLDAIPLGNPPADWLEGLGGVAGTWGLLSLAGLAAGAIGGAAIPAAALLKAAGAVGIGAAASIGASALRQAALESASRRVVTTGGERVEIVPLADRFCVYRFPQPAPSRRDTAVGTGGILFAAALQESSATLRAVALLPESIDGDALVQAVWGEATVNLSPGPVISELGARNWSGVGPLPQEPPPSLLVELRINGAYAGATVLGKLLEPPESAEARGLEVVGHRHQLIWSPRPIGRFRKTITLPTADTRLNVPPRPPVLRDGGFRLSAIWRQPGLSFRSEVFASEESVRRLRDYLVLWEPRPADVQITETSRSVHPDAANIDFEPVRGRFWTGEVWLRYYWPAVGPSGP